MLARYSVFFFGLLPCAGTAGHNTSVQAGAVDEVYFHSGIASTVIDVACVDLLDRHFDWEKVRLAREK